MHAFLLNIYLVLALLGHVLCICSALVDAASFPKCLCQITLPLAVNENSTLFSKYFLFFAFSF